jgi:tight adherence protein B
MLPLDPNTQIALIIGAMSGLTLLLVAAAFAGGSSRRFSRRLNAVAVRKSPSAISGDPTVTRSLTRRDSNTPGLDRIFRLLPRREALVERLQKTGRDISVGQYMLVTIGVMVFMTLVMLIFAHLTLALSLAFGGAIGAFIPHYLIGRMGRRRVYRFISLFP